MSPQSPNAHWLWSGRHDNGQPSSGGATPPSPGTPRRNNGSSNNTHNRDWLWATRFSSSSSGAADQQPRTIEPSRSSDAIMNPHEANQSNSLVSAPSTPTSNRGETTQHNTTAGELFSSNTSMYHDHWQRRDFRRRCTQQTPVTLTLSPSRRHPHWNRQNSANSNSSSDALPVTVLPAI